MIWQALVLEKFVPEFFLDARPGLSDRPCGLAIHGPWPAAASMNVGEELQGVQW